MALPARRCFARWLPLLVLPLVLPRLPIAHSADTLPRADDVVAARVNGEPIHERDVQTYVELELQGRQVSAETLPMIEAAVLSQLIDRHLVEKELRTAGALTPAAKVDSAINQIRLQLEQRKQSWNDYLRDRHLTESLFRSQVAWQMTWEQFAQRKLTDQELEAYFNSHHQEYDGTLVHVCHVLLRPQRVGDPQAATKLTEQARQLREDIVGGRITFEDAAKKYSAGPSREHGGDLGFIPRQGVMVDAFSQAAFALKANEISEPVITLFGVHLIKRLDVKPGDKKWRESRDALQTAASQALYNDMAQAARAKAKIEFGPGIPHFKLGTKELERP